MGSGRGQRVGPRERAEAREWRLTEEVSDRDRLSTLTDDAVDGEMGVDGSHLVEESLGDTDDHVLDERSDGSEAGNVLSASVPDTQGDRVGLLDELDVHVDVPDVLVENTSRPGHLDDSGLDGDSDALGDGEVFGLEDVLHLSRGGRPGGDREQWAKAGRRRGRVRARG